MPSEYHRILDKDTYFKVNELVKYCSGRRCDECKLVTYEKCLILDDEEDIKLKYDVIKG